MKGIKRTIVLILILSLLIGTFSLSVSADDERTGVLPNGDEYIIGDLIVTFSDSVRDQNQAKEIAASYGCEINEILNWGKRLVFMTIINGADTLETKELMQQDPMIRFAELNTILYKDIVIDDPEEKYSGLNIDWDNLVPGKDYAEDSVTVTFADDLEDQEVIYTVAETCGCEVSEIIMWNDWEGGKIVHMIILDGSTVKNKISQLEDNEYVKYAEVNSIFVPDDPEPSEEPNKEYSGLSVDSWKRLAGDTRYATMKKISEEGWNKDSCDTVIVATGASFPDALSGSSLAGVYDCPVILTSTETLSAAAQSELVRLGAEHVIILGSTSAVSTTVENSIKAIVGNNNVTRLQGANRYETCSQIYTAGLGNWSNMAILATGVTAPDALAISSYAYATKSPIFLVRYGNTLQTAMTSAITSGAINKVVILGSTDVIDSTLEDWCKNQLGNTNVIRLYGSDRYQTSAQISDWASGNMPNMSVQPVTALNYQYPAVVNGGNDHFADALSGGPLCGHNGAVMLLTQNSNTINYTVSNNIIPHALDIHLGYVLGAENVLSSDLYDWLNYLVLNDYS